MEYVQGNTPPDGLTALPLRFRAREFFGRPITHEKQLRTARHLIADEMAALAAREVVRMDDDSIYFLQTSLSEGLQNGLRNADGVYHVGISRTQEGLVCVDMPNLVPDYPEEKIITNRSGGRAVVIGRGSKRHMRSNTLQSVTLEDWDESMHGRGFQVMAGLGLESLGVEVDENFDDLLAQETLTESMPTGLYKEPAFVAGTERTGGPLVVPRMVSWFVGGQAQDRFTPVA